MKKADDLKYEYFSAIKQKKVDWLWYPYIPYGKITVMQGDPGEGKSTFMLNIAALISKGEAMPDGYCCSKPQNIIYQTSEDDLSDTVKPRLLAAGADCSMIAYIIDEECPLTLEDSRIEKAIRETHARLFILDPLQAYVSQHYDLFSAGRIRQQLQKLSVIAAKYRCAVVIIGHMNKASGEKNLYRGLGTIDIAAIARSVLMISRDKKDPTVRYMFPVKSSLAPEGPMVAFSLNEKNGVKWLGQYDLDTARVSDFDCIKGKKELAIETISNMLEFRDVRSVEILNKLQIMGVSERTIQLAKKQLGVTSYRVKGAWFWHLEDVPCEQRDYLK